MQDFTPSSSVCSPPPHHTHTQAQNANETGDYDSAKRLGQFSLGWNVGVYIFYVLATIGWIIAVIVVVTTRIYYINPLFG